MFKKLIFIGFLAALISGCDLQIHSHQLEGYQKNCAEYGGIAVIYLNSDGGVFCVCKDGTRVEWVKSDV